MSYLKRFFGHLNTVLTHKWWVFYYACHLGYSVRGLFHDMSKFSPVEFFEGVKYWNGKRSPILEAKEMDGISYAWLHHRGRNKHHYEYWIDLVNDKIVYHKVPFKYAIEMVCDWMGACRAYNGSGNLTFDKEYEWWERKSKTIRLNSTTKTLVDTILWNLKEYGRYNTEAHTLSIVRNFIDSWRAAYDDVTFLD